MKELITSSIDIAISYKEYRNLVKEKVDLQQTTGPNQSDDLANYTRLNDHRMKRLDKTLMLNDRTLKILNSLETPLTWLIITEGWCGDAAQALPVMNAMASMNANLDLKIILRDENLDLMDKFLTNNGRSIPKLIFIKPETYEVLGDWGPRPAEAQQLYHNLRNLDLPYSEITIEMQNWYNKDKTHSIQNEISTILNTANSEMKKKALV